MEGNLKDAECSDYVIAHTWDSLGNCKYTKQLVTSTTKRTFKVTGHQDILFSFKNGKPYGCSNETPCVEILPYTKESYEELKKTEVKN